ncbi:MAG: DNA mismatch repair protein MutS [Gammaproteobacteria bacterium]|nr:Smr/MutS family protein [Gammaproteobacteria bacterium]NNC96524.1 DNA mismatch repair protein MutS [Gammaproteobacteria bacterium]NNM13028.1 DNA mismatch repair protein MutS [Gammaproteobacteria bacterium]
MSDKPSDDDRKALNKAMRAVKPIVHNQADVGLPKPRAKAKFTRADERRALLEALETDVQEAEFESGEILSYARPGVQKSVIRRLRRGDYSVQRVCDLHGETVASAKLILSRFMQECQDDGIRCVRVIHGKGLRSGHQGPVIKPKVNRWLRVWDHVVAFHSARIQDGGTGAVVVLLK